MTFADEAEGSRRPAGACNPLALLLATLLVVAGSLGVRSLQAGTAGVAIEVLLLALLAFRPDPATWLRLGVAVVTGLSVGWSAWLLGEPRSLETALTAFLRIEFFALPGAVLLGYVEASELGDQLAQRARLPARPVVAAVASLHRLGELAADLESLRRAHRVRGVGPGRSPAGVLRETGSLAFGLLVASLRRAARMSLAMDARGFALPTSGRRRTWAEPAPWHAADTAAILIALLVSAVPGAAGLLGV